MNDQLPKHIYSPGALASWNAMDEAQAPSSLAAMPGSPSHVHFEITTEQGNTVMIKGDPKMPEATRKALAAMIDAAVKAANAGELKAMENAALSGAKEKP